MAAQVLITPPYEAMAKATRNNDLAIGSVTRLDDINQVVRASSILPPSIKPTIADMSKLAHIIIFIIPQGNN